jgi:hypothetical protein
VPYCSGLSSPSEVNLGRVVAPAVSLQHATGQIRTRSQVRRWVIGGQSDTGSCFSPNNLIFVCQYQSTEVPYPFLHVSLKTMWNDTEKWGLVECQNLAHVMTTWPVRIRMSYGQQ